MSNAIRKNSYSRAIDYRFQETWRTRQVEDMTFKERNENWTGQTGRAFTPKQRRRLVQKSKHKVAVSGRTWMKVIRVEEVREEIVPAAPVSLFKDYAPVFRPCGGTEYCITKSNNKAKSTHVGCQKFEVAA